MQQTGSTRSVLWALGLGAFLLPLAAFWYLDIAAEPAVREARELRDRASQGGDYLLAHFNPDTGTFDYLVDAQTGATSSEYNLLRHAGTTFSLLTLYEATGKDTYRSAAERALEFLLAQERPCPPPHTDLRCLYEAGQVKLGGNALAVLALSEHVRTTGTTTHLARAQAYAAWLTATQATSGEFLLHILNADGTKDDHVSLYYPGEAIFALMRLYALDHDERWHAAAARGADWLIGVRDVGKGTDELEHDHWLLYGLRELYRTEQDSRYLIHARQLTDAIVRAQHVAPADPVWEGGFYNPPRSTPTATRVEGVGAAYRIFHTAGDTAYAQKSLALMRLGTGFMLRTQVTEGRIVREGLAQSARGGFTSQLDDTEIRIDYVQHNISALLGYAEALESSTDVR